MTARCQHGNTRMKDDESWWVIFEQHKIYSIVGRYLFIVVSFYTWLLSGITQLFMYVNV